MTMTNRHHLLDTPATTYQRTAHHDHSHSQRVDTYNTAHSHDVFDLTHNTVNLYIITAPTRCPNFYSQRRVTCSETELKSEHVLNSDLEPNKDVARLAFFYVSLDATSLSPIFFSYSSHRPDTVCP